MKFVAVNALTKGESKLPADTIVRREARSRTKKEARGGMVYDSCVSALPANESVQKQVPAHWQ